MASAWNLILLSSIAGTVSLVQLVPQYSISASYAWTFSVLYFSQSLLLSIWKVILYPKFFTPLRHLPSPPGGSFWNGHFSSISRETSGEPMRRWVNEVPNDGLIYYTFLFNAPRVLVTSPKALAEVLVQKNYDFIKPSQLRNGIGAVLGIGVLLAEGEEHKIQRKNLMPAFAYRHVKDLYPVFWSKSCELVTAIISTVQDASSSSTEEKVTMPCSVIEIGGWASRATLDIIGVAGMGQSFNAIQDPNAELNLTYRKVFVRGSQAQILGYLGFVLPFWFLRRIPVQRNFDVFRAVNVIKKVCRQLIQQKQRKLDQKEKTEVDILSVALESGGFSQENLVDQMMTFLAAGHETTASATIWAVYLLCQNPEVQTKLREEVRRNLPSANDTSTVATSEMLGRMPYLHAVCNEVLRVYAPVPLTLREAAKDTSILGQFIPKGTRVIMAPWAVNMSTEFWGEDAGKFDPERWMRPGMANSGGAESNYSFLTFLHGPRSCIGQTFAKAELACLVASLVGRFEMELNDKDAVIEIKEGITAKPKDGLNVRMKVLEGW